jgi:hypothetical protein
VLTFKDGVRLTRSEASRIVREKLAAQAAAAQYIVVRDGRVTKESNVIGADNARAWLAPIELGRDVLYVKVGA